MMVGWEWLPVLMTLVLLLAFCTITALLRSIDAHRMAHDDNASPIAGRNAIAFAGMYLRGAIQGLGFLLVAAAILAAGS